MIGLTATQADFVRICGELTDSGRRPPSIREIAREMGYGCNHAHVHAIARACRERGWLAVGPRLVLLRRLPPAEECEVELTDAGRAWRGGAA